MMRNLMIDLETMGTKVGCPVIAIGACFFDPDEAGSEIGATFSVEIDLADALRYGDADGATVKWWLGQSDAARGHLLNGYETAETAFLRFYAWIKANCPDPIVWGNGATFDISILESAFPMVIGKPAPWSFRDVRDCRTIKALADGVVAERPVSVPPVGTAHVAIDDAIRQALWVSHYWRGLRGQG